MRKPTLKSATLQGGKLVSSATTVTVDYWKACEIIGEDAAAKLWGAADADQDERLKVRKPARAETSRRV